ncbi:hypothetical protein U9R90_25070 [Streptomyces sp. E11-3]|uniref:hypothetical protein n=1 Tax=Streptomyces sp. E11-3 TaxID=3110112 RepID=UPI003980C00E
MTDPNGLARKVFLAETAAVRTHLADQERTATDRAAALLAPIEAKVRELKAQERAEHRAAVLREAADEIAGIDFHPNARARSLDIATGLAHRLRRMADEEQPTNHLSQVLAEIAAERARQDAKWGEQSHPDLDRRDIGIVTRNEYAFRATRWQEINTERATPTVTAGRCSGCSEEPHTHTAWDGVLLEEVYEALAESDPARLRAELVQVAAVATNYIQAIDRRTAKAQQDGAAS